MLTYSYLFISFDRREAQSEALLINFFTSFEAAMAFAKNLKTVLAFGANKCNESDKLIGTEVESRSVVMMRYKWWQLYS